MTSGAAAAVIAPCLMHAPSTSSKEHRDAQTRLEETLMKRMIHSVIHYLYENDQNEVALALVRGTVAGATGAQQRRPPAEQAGEG